MSKLEQITHYSPPPAPPDEEVNVKSLVSKFSQKSSLLSDKEIKLPPEKQQRSKYKLKKLDSASVKKDHKNHKYKTADNNGESSNSSSSSEVIEGDEEEEENNGERNKTAAQDSQQQQRRKRQGSDDGYNSATSSDTPRTDSFVNINNITLPHQRTSHHKSINSVKFLDRLFPPNIF